MSLLRRLLQPLWVLLAIVFLIEASIIADGAQRLQRVLEITGLLDELAFRTNGAATRRPAS